ncbi:MAG: O-methyltransferase [Chitinophagia bacterium]|nr:O-methyltransferase [Chitinophagia bacterium]
MELINTLAAAYAEKYSSPEPGWAQVLAAETRSIHPKHHMLSGHVQGRFLSVLSQIMQPNYILEIGTFTGYSAGCLAEGLTPHGELHTIECREQDASIAASHWKQLPQSHQIHLHVGNAFNIIPGIDRIWDLVFLDADKINYCNYYQMIMPKLRKGGLLIADNVFFHGEVLQPILSGKNAIAIQQFNEMVAADTSCEKIVVTIRDGITLIVKK